MLSLSLTLGLSTFRPRPHQSTRPTASSRLMKERKGRKPSQDEGPPFKRQRVGVPDEAKVGKVDDVFVPLGHKAMENAKHRDGKDAQEPERGVREPVQGLLPLGGVVELLKSPGAGLAQLRILEVVAVTVMVVVASLPETKWRV